MAINWFEGGRRINRLFLTLIALGGVGYLFLGGYTTVFLFSSTPDEPWYFAPRECEQPSEEVSLWELDTPSLGGRMVALCFLAEKGDILYAEANPFDQFDARMTPQQRADAMRRFEADPYAGLAIPEDDYAGIAIPETAAPRKPVNYDILKSGDAKSAYAKGKASLAQQTARMTPQKWYWHADRYDEQAKAYMDKRKADFVLTPDLIRRIGEGTWSLRWNRFTARFKEASPIAFGAMFFLWFLATVVGWIVRGFAGIPSDQDFRPSKVKREAS